VKDAGVTCFFDGSCHLRIEPLTPAAPPVCSPDRPLDHADRETTTAVEYPGVTGPWSLFVVGAFPGRDSRMTLSPGREEIFLAEFSRKIRIGAAMNGPLE